MLPSHERVKIPLTARSEQRDGDPPPTPEAFQLRLGKQVGDGAHRSSGEQWTDILKCYKRTHWKVTGFEPYRENTEHCFHKRC